MPLPLYKVEPQPAAESPPLSTLRRAARRARCAPRLDAGRACRLIGPDTTPDAAMSLLIRVLPLATGRRPRILAVDAETRSFDEDWILALLRAEIRGDRDSRRFLLGRRCTPEGAARLTELLRVMHPNVIVEMAS